MNATFQLLALALISLTAMDAAGQQAKAIASGVAIPDEGWNRVFTRTDGWTGGDVAGSVDLGDARTLWVYGDTWSGEVRDGKHVPGSRLVNNSIAIQQRTSVGESPLPDDVTFYFGPPDANGKATAWVSPPDDRSEDSQRTWFWTSGGAVVTPGPTVGQQRLIIFLFHIGKRADGQGIWGFQSVGGALAIIDNMHESPDQWHPKVVAIPHVIAAEAARQRQDLAETSWGVAACLDPLGKHVYIYGVRETAPLNKQLVLARVATDQVDAMEHWRFWAGDGRWSDRLSDAIPVADNVVNELSVSRQVDDSGQATLIMVHSEPVLGPRIFIRTAADHEGPWSDPRPIYTVPEVQRNSKYFTYAAKGHLQLAQPGELLITYVVNSHDFAAMFNDATIYRPRFLRISMTQILGKH